MIINVHEKHVCEGQDCPRERDFSSGAILGIDRVVKSRLDNDGCVLGVCVSVGLAQFSDPPTEILTFSIMYHHRKRPSHHPSLLLSRH